ncbi:MAG: hypothetical protein NTV87_14470 [Ignavibacteriae bacterium]|jgi:hypothetical protein|nr:hypothetical protein [Ignavibacteriota bacterium]
MDNTFLILSLFLPRVALIIFYFIHAIPQNNVPFIGEALLTVFLPRVLVLIYIADILGTGSVWFWIHLAAALIVYSGSGKYYKKKFRKNQN